MAKKICLSGLVLLDDKFTSTASDKEILNSIVDDIATRCGISRKAARKLFFNAVLTGREHLLHEVDVTLQFIETENNSF